MLSEKLLSSVGLTHRPELLTFEAEQRGLAGGGERHRSKYTEYFGWTELGVVRGSSEVENGIGERHCLDGSVVNSRFCSEEDVGSFSASIYWLTPIHNLVS